MDTCSCGHDRTAHRDDPAHGRDECLVPGCACIGMCRRPVTWQTVAAARGFQGLGNGRWLAPNGQQVAEGFVAAYCRPEVAETGALALEEFTAPTRGCRGRTPSAPTPRVATAAYRCTD